MTILLSAAFAQATMQRATTSVEKSSVGFTMQKQLLSKRLAKKRVNPNAVRAKVSFQHVACYKSEANPDKAVVKFINSMDWGDGTGYQVLLDSKAEFISQLNEYGQINQETVRDLYSAATTKIPANAAPELEGSIIVFGEADSAIIDPGTYDMIVTNPSSGTEGVHVYVASEGALDDIDFKQGITYVFHVIPNGWNDYVELIPEWDLELTSLTLPMANCQMTEAPVTIEVSNKGKNTAANFKVSYSVVDLEGEPIGETVEETFTESLAPGARKEYIFAKKIEFAADDDVIYGVIAEVLPLEDETRTDDNEDEGLLVRKTAVEAPYTFQLDTFDLAINMDDWDLDEDYFGDVLLVSYGLGAPAVTRCITMEAGESYRLSYERMCGFSWLWDVYTNYSILFGKVNTDISDWDTIYSAEDVFDDFYFRHAVAAQATEAGEYAFAFVEDLSSEGGGLNIKNIHVSKVLGKDVKLSDFYAEIPSMMPLEHASGTFKGSATITNYGKNNIEKATLKVTAGTETLVTKEIAVGRADTSVTTTFDLTVNFTALGKVDITATVSIADDEDPDNNELVQSVAVNDKVMAYDFVDEDSYSINYAVGGNGLGCGIPFTITKKDTLTGVSVGWMEMQQNMDIEISVYRWDATAATVGDMLYRESHRRGTEAGQHEYTIPALLLDPGSYIIFAHQTGSSSFGLICDRKPHGTLYIMTSSGQIGSQTNFGYPSVRAIFGHDGKPVAKDLAVKEISKPKDLGLFSNEEPIVVKVRNNGYEVVEAPLTVMVNKDNLPAQTVKLAAYAEAEYTFKGDLSAADAEFVLTATVALEGDENEENNTITRTVRSYPPIDPYKMDFEYCDDFAMDNELVGWKGVVGETDAAGSYGFEGVSFPNSGELFAFIAYNAALTSPVTEGGEAHGGERFGASFAWANTAGAVENNAWLVSPQLKLAEQDPCIKFFVRSFTDEYGLEKYNVLISTSDNKPESFVQLGETFEAPAEWTDVTVNLKEYSGKDVYLAIQCVSNDAFIFMIDDIMVTSNTATEGKAADVRLNAWPNPANEMVYISADQAIEQVCIYTPAGNLLYQSADNMNAEEFRYNVKNLNSGLYIARVKTAQGSGVVKFVVR